MPRIAGRISERQKFRDEKSYPDPNPQNLESVFWRIVLNGGFSLLFAVFALLEDSLACGALGSLPSAPTTDLTMSPPTSIAVAPSVPSRNNGSSSSSSSSSSSCEG